MIYKENFTLEKLNIFLNEHIDNSDISIDQICKNIGVSRTQLTRIVKVNYNLSISLYIRKLRIEKAKNLLLATDKRVSEIGDEVGIDSPQNFTKYFTQEFGINPTEFRKKALLANIENEKIKILKESTIEITNEKTSFLTQKRKKTWLTLVPICILFLGLFFWQKNKPNLQALSSVSEHNNNYSENTIAILPFKNLSETKNSFYTEGVMDQIHNTLASISELKIISTISSNNYLNSNKTLSKIADELHVKYLINGSVLQINKDVKITVNLISGLEEKVIWTKNSEGKTDDIFKLMNTISKEVVEEFNKKLNHNIERNLDKIPTKSMAAYNEYLQGKQLVKTRNKEKLEAGIIKLDNAIEFDPTFADAYSERANAYWLIADGAYSDIEQADKMAEKNALMAIRLDSENSLAYGTLANIYRSQNKWEQANTTYQIALKYNPNHALNNYWYSLMLRTLGQIDEAIKYSTKATELDPLYEVIMAGHVVNCIYGNRLDLAKKYIESNKLLLNENWTYYWVKGIYKIKIGDFSDALKELEYAHKLNPKVKAINNQILFCHAKMGNLTVVNKFLGQVPDLPINYSSLAIVYAGLGDKEKAMTFIQKNAELGNIPTDIKISPFFKLLHNDLRFEAILQKFGLSESTKIALK